MVSKSIIQIVPIIHSFIHCNGGGNIPSKAFSLKDEYLDFLEYCHNAMNDESSHLIQVALIKMFKK